MTNSANFDDKSPVAQEKCANDDFDQNKRRPAANSAAQTNVKKDSKQKVGKTQKSYKGTKEADPATAKQRVITRNKSKNLSLPESSKKCEKQSRKQKSPVKQQVLSPNHSITEYFSCLDLKENHPEGVNETNETKVTLKSSIQPSSLSCAAAASLSTKRSLAARKNDSGNHKVTEYFAIRKSDRKVGKEIDKQKELENKIRDETEDGLEIKEFGEKGRGVVTTREFHKGDFVVEYIGELIDRTEAEKRELQYAKNKNLGCYMYYFKHKDQSYCIDATSESGKLGRLINHSRKGNLTSRIIQVDLVPHLVLFAKADIPVDTELLYDYGDRRQESIKNHPWLTL